MAPWLAIASYFNLPPLQTYHSFSVLDFQIINQFASALHVYCMQGRGFLAYFSIDSGAYTDSCIHLLFLHPGIFFILFYCKKLCSSEAGEQCQIKPKMVQQHQEIKSSSGRSYWQIGMCEWGRSRISASLPWTIVLQPYIWSCERSAGSEINRINVSFIYVVHFIIADDLQPLH